jgi:hypothetical protein
VLVIAIVETIVEVDAGTVYKSALDVFAGADCPSILYVVAIFYAPILRNDVTFETSVAVDCVASTDVSAIPCTEVVAA